MHMKRNFPGFGAKHHARSLHEISEIEHLVEEIYTRLRQLIDTKEELHLPVHIFNMSKRKLPHGASGANAAGKNDFNFFAVFFSAFKFCNGLRAGVCSLSARRIWFDPLSAEFFNFLQADFFEGRIFWHGYSLLQKKPRAPHESAGTRGQGFASCLTQLL